MSFTSLKIFLLIAGVNSFIGWSAITGFAQTTRWIYMTTDSKQETDWYLDKNSIERFDGKVRYWDKRIFADGSYAKSRTLIYCSDRKFQMLQAFTYTSDSRQINRIDGGSLIDVVPESIIEKFYDVLCGESSTIDSEKEDWKVKGKNDVSSKVRSGKVRVITERANIRSRPAMDSEVLDTAQIGTNFQPVSGQSVRGWFEIYTGDGDRTAWIHGNTIEFIEE